MLPKSTVTTGPLTENLAIAKMYGRGHSLRHKPPGASRRSKHDAATMSRLYDELVQSKLARYQQQQRVDVEERHGTDEKRPLGFWEKRLEEKQREEQRRLDEHCRKQARVTASPRYTSRSSRGSVAKERDNCMRRKKRRNVRHTGRRRSHSVSSSPSSTSSSTSSHISLSSRAREPLASRSPGVSRRARRSAEGHHHRSKEGRHRSKETRHLRSNSSSKVRKAQERRRSDVPLTSRALDSTEHRNCEWNVSLHEAISGPESAATRPEVASQVGGRANVSLGTTPFGSSNGAATSDCKLETRKAAERAYHYSSRPDRSERRRRHHRRSDTSSDSSATLERRRRKRSRMERSQGRSDRRRLNETSSRNRLRHRSFDLSS